MRANGRSSVRVYLRELVSACGAEVTSFDSGADRVEVELSPRPDARISFSPGARVGQPVSFSLTASGYALGKPGIYEWHFYIDNQEVDYGKPSGNLSKTVTHTFTSPGNHSLRLEVTDQVGRGAVVNQTINVQAVAPPPEPPEPPPPKGAPIADFDMPPTAYVGDSVPIVNKSRASPGFTLVRSHWESDPWVDTSSLGTTGNGGGTLVFAEEGAYTITLTVWDDAGNSASKAKTIFVTRVVPPPPPPPPPEPENIPPVARISAPSEVPQGTTVDVRNSSYDPDGQIVSSQWNISPTNGVTENLGDGGGTVTFAEAGTYTITLTVTDDRGDSDTTSKDIRVTNQPPRARIDAPDTVTQGDEVVIRSTSYDPDGEIASTQWSVRPEGMVGTLSGDKSTVYFDKVGDYTITLTVKDNFGLSGTATATIHVQPAVPKAYFTWSGTPKQNRKLVFDSSGSTSSARYPVDWSKNQWQFVPPVGVPQDAVKIVASSDLKTRTVEFKEPGDYKVRLAVTNTAGNTSEWYEQTISVVEDKPPVADFYVPGQALRDPSNNNKAAVQLVDKSYSPDGDTIGSRVWQYRYDSDNDGDFTDEAWVVLDSGNNPNPTLYTTQVGKYEFRLAVTEAPGEEMIPEFYGPEDLRTANTDTKPLADRTTEVINVQPVVNFDLIRKKKADIVFTIGQAADAKLADLSGRIARLVAPVLAAANIDARITSIQTYQMTARDTFSWQIYDHYGRWGEDTGGYYTGQNHIIIRDKDIYFYGYGMPAFKDFLFMPDTTVGKKTFEFDLSEVGINYHSMEGGGFLFNAKIENGTLSGYCLLYGQSGIELYEIPGVNVNAFHEEQWYLLANAPYARRLSTFPKNGSNHHVRIEVTPERIDLWDNGVKVINGFNLPTIYGNGFGPIASYAPHGCNMLSWFTFNNLVMTTTDAKQLVDVLKEPSWRPEAGHFLVNISDVPLPELNDPAALGVILSRTLSNNIYFIGLGTGANKGQYLTFVAQNDGHGVFYDNSDMESALAATAEYIKTVMASQPQLLEQYVLLNEEVEYRTYYTDAENDPEFQRRWLYLHDPYWFKNSLGLADFNGQFLPDQVTRFDKTGKYDVQFQARDNPKPDDRFDEYRLWPNMPLDKLTLYVHRRPLALYSVQVTKRDSTSYNVAVQDQSYDPDHQGEPGNGLRAWEWRWKEATATTWNAGLPPSVLPAGHTYLFSLRVQDIDGPGGVGEWSLPNVRVVSTSPLNLPPVAQFSVSPNPLPLGKALTYNDMSYDPNGDAIVERHWRMVKLPSGSWMDYGGTPPNNFPSLGVGDYKIELTVKDAPGAWSDPFYQVVTVIPDNNPPVARFTITPNPVPVDMSMTYNDTSYDPDGDPIVAREWRWRRVGAPSFTPGQPTSPAGLGIGDFEIQERVKDQPALSQLTPMWSSWYSYVLHVIDGNHKPVARFTVTPNPAITDEPVTYTDTSYDPDGAGIAERVWQVTTLDGTVLGEYRNQLPPRVFASTGWGDGGAGTYKVRLRVRDNSPNGISPPLWSDWAEETLTVVMPLTGSAEITPNPALSGYRIRVTAQTSGYAEEVRVRFPDNKWFGWGDEITLVPDNPTGSKENIWRGAYLTDVKTPDGPYPVTVTIKRASVAPKTLTIPLTLVIQGDIYDQVKVRMRSHGLPGDWVPMH